MTPHRLAAAGLIMILLTGCGSFNREWRSALEEPVPAGSPLGAWDGSWISSANGHHGRLRCVVREDPDSKGNIALFRATWAKVFSGTYSVPMQASQGAGGWLLTGKHDLGALYGGLYSYEALISNDSFSATYTSRWDYGRFEMTRPAQRQDR